MKSYWSRVGSKSHCVLAEEDLDIDMHRDSYIKRKVEMAGMDYKLRMSTAVRSRGGNVLACSPHSLRALTLEPLELKFPASRTEVGNFCCYSFLLETNAGFGLRSGV